MPAARGVVEHLQQLAGEARLDRVQGGAARELDGEEAGGLVERLALGVREVDERAQAQQRGVALAQRADPEDAGDGPVGELDLRAPRACQRRGHRRGVDPLALGALDGQHVPAGVDQRDRQRVVERQDAQHAALVGALGDRAGQRLAPVDRARQLLLPRRRLQVGHRVRDGGEGDLDRQRQQRQRVLPAGVHQFARRLRPLGEQAEQQPAGARLGDPRHVGLRIGGGQPDAVGQHQLVLTDVGPRVGAAR